MLKKDVANRQTTGGQTDRRLPTAYTALCTASLDAKTSVADKKRIHCPSSSCDVR